MVRAFVPTLRVAVVEAGCAGWGGASKTWGPCYVEMPRLWQAARAQWGVDGPSGDLLGGEPEHQSLQQKAGLRGIEMKKNAHWGDEFEDLVSKALIAMYETGPAKKW